METNKKLNKYDFKYNNITDRGKCPHSVCNACAGLERITQSLETDAQHVI